MARSERAPQLTSPEVILVVGGEAKEALVNVAELMARLVEAGIGGAASAHLTCCDGSGPGPPGAPVQLTITSPHALRRLL